MSARACSFPGCVKPHDSNGWCSTHNSRIRTHGDPYGKRCETCTRPLEEIFGRAVRTQRFCGDGCRPRCEANGCTRPNYKGYVHCSAHAGQVKSFGGVLDRPVRQWASKDAPCLQCGATVPAVFNRRATCSSKCDRLWRLYKGARPSVGVCGSCQAEFSRDVRLPSGSLKRVDTRLCPNCSRRRKFKTTVFAVAAAWGTTCHICSDAVDMKMRRSESLFSPSIDHLVPRSRGGSDEMNNLRVTHFWCNAVKSDRVGFTI